MKGGMKLSKTTLGFSKKLINVAEQHKRWAKSGIKANVTETLSPFNCGTVRLGNPNNKGQSITEDKDYVRLSNDSKSIKDQKAWYGQVNATKTSKDQKAWYGQIVVNKIVATIKNLFGIK